MHGNGHSGGGMNIRCIAALVAVLMVTTASGLGAENIVQLWSTAEVPPAVELKKTTVLAGTTALFILDIEERTCNVQARPRCPESAARIAGFLNRARTAGMPVIYSLTSRGTPETILPEVAPRPDEPVVSSGVDKFYTTNLENLLRERGVQTVIVTGTTAEGAVLHTATGAAMRNLNVIVPVDGMSAATLYAEQYTAWHLVNAPGTRRRTTLTTFDDITIKP